MVDATGCESLQARSSALSLLISWGAGEQVAHSIIGVPDCATQEIKLRISVVFEMNDYLSKIFENPKNIAGFMSMRNDNSYFEGSTPLEKISDGTYESLRECAKRLRALSMG